MEACAARTFGERAHKCAQMIGLLESAIAHLDDICQIFAYLAQKLTSNVALAGEEAVERILVIAGRPRQSVEGLQRSE